VEPGRPYVKVTFVGAYQKKDKSMKSFGKSAKIETIAEIDVTNCSTLEELVKSSLPNLNPGILAEIAEIYMQYSRFSAALQKIRTITHDPEVLAIVERAFMTLDEI
jgi:hypothetical protein